MLERCITKSFGWMVFSPLPTSLNGKSVRSTHRGVVPYNFQQKNKCWKTYQNSDIKSICQGLLFNFLVCFIFVQFIKTLLFFLSIRILQLRSVLGGGELYWNWERKLGGLLNLRWEMAREFFLWHDSWHPAGSNGFRTICS